MTNALREFTNLSFAAIGGTIGLALGRRVERFGGTFHGDLSTGKLIWAALCTDEANLIDLVKFGQGNRFSLNHLESENPCLKLDAQYRSFAVPIFFLLGRYDWHVPSILAKSYFDRIQAPYKKIIWFEQSGAQPAVRRAGKVRSGVDQRSPASGERTVNDCLLQAYASAMKSAPKFSHLSITRQISARKGSRLPLRNLDFQGVETVWLAT